jgi:hypothetical protein
MSIKLLTRLLKYVISIAAILLVFLPHATVFIPDDGDENWKAVYIYDDILSIIIYSPFLLLWPGYLLLNQGPFKIIMIYTLVILSFCYAIIAFLSLTLLAQDYEPNIGTGIAILLFPLLLALLITDRIARKRSI